jgi:hypothetical protein
MNKQSSNLWSFRCLPSLPLQLCQTYRKPCVQANRRGGMADLTWATGSVQPRCRGMMRIHICCCWSHCTYTCFNFSSAFHQTLLLLVTWEVWISLSALRCFFINKRVLGMTRPFPWIHAAHPANNNVLLTTNYPCVCGWREAGSALCKQAKGDTSYELTTPTTSSLLIIHWGVLLPMRIVLTPWALPVVWSVWPHTMQSEERPSWDRNIFQDHQGKIWWIVCEQHICWQDWKIIPKTSCEPSRKSAMTFDN